MEKIKVLLLGSQGRLATTFIKRHGERLSLVEVGSRDSTQSSGNPYFSSSSDMSWVFETWMPDVVLNMAAIWGSDRSDTEIWNANYYFPAEVAHKLSNKPVRWIQVDSYFNLYFDIHAIDKDLYSMTKRMFFNSLTNHESSNIHPTQVIAPHLVGPNEPPGRIFRIITTGIAKSETYNLGSGKQFLPYLHMTDSADQLMAIIASTKDFEDKRVMLRPLAQTKIMDLVSVAHAKYSCSLDLPKFGGVADARREFYKEMESFGDSEWLPEPKITLAAMLDEQIYERYSELGVNS